MGREWIVRCMIFSLVLFLFIGPLTYPLPLGCRRIKPVLNLDTHPADNTQLLFALSIPSVGSEGSVSDSLFYIHILLNTGKFEEAIETAESIKSYLRRGNALQEIASFLIERKNDASKGAEVLKKALEALYIAYGQDMYVEDKIVSIITLASRLPVALKEEIWDQCLKFASIMFPNTSNRIMSLITGCSQKTTTSLLSPQLLIRSLDTMRKRKEAEESLTQRSKVIDGILNNISLLLNDSNVPLPLKVQLLKEVLDTAQVEEYLFLRSKLLQFVAMHSPKLEDASQVESILERALEIAKGFERDSKEEYNKVKVAIAGAYGEIGRKDDAVEMFSEVIREAGEWTRSISGKWVSTLYEAREAVDVLTMAVRELPKIKDPVEETKLLNEILDLKIYSPEAVPLFLAIIESAVRLEPSLSLGILQRCKSIADILYSKKYSKKEEVLYALTAAYQVIEGKKDKFIEAYEKGLLSDPEKRGLGILLNKNEIETLASDNPKDKALLYWGYCYILPLSDHSILNWAKEEFRKVEDLETKEAMLDLITLFAKRGDIEAINFLLGLREESIKGTLPSELESYFLTKLKEVSPHYILPVIVASIAESPKTERLNLLQSLISTMFPTLSSEERRRVNTILLKLLTTNSSDIKLGKGEVRKAVLSLLLQFLPYSTEKEKLFNIFWSNYRKMRASEKSNILETIPMHLDFLPVILKIFELDYNTQIPLGDVEKKIENIEAFVLINEFLNYDLFLRKLIGEQEQKQDVSLFTEGILSVAKLWIYEKLSYFLAHEPQYYKGNEADTAKRLQDIVVKFKRHEGLEPQEGSFLREFLEYTAMEVINEEVRVAKLGLPPVGGELYFPYLKGSYKDEKIREWIFSFLGISVIGGPLGFEGYDLPALRSSRNLNRMICALKDVGLFSPDGWMNYIVDGKMGDEVKYIGWVIRGFTKERVFNVRTPFREHRPHGLAFYGSVYPEFARDKKLFTPLGATYFLYLDLIDDNSYSLGRNLEIVQFLCWLLQSDREKYKQFVSGLKRLLKNFRLSESEFLDYIKKNYKGEEGMVLLKQYNSLKRANAIPFIKEGGRWRGKRYIGLDWILNAKWFSGKLKKIGHVLSYETPWEETRLQAIFLEAFKHKYEGGSMLSRHITSLIYELFGQLYFEVFPSGILK